MVGPHSTILLESKLTENEWGHIQIAALYTPLLRHIFRRPVVGVLVCKTVTRKPKYLIQHPAEVLDTTAEHIYTWHYLA